MTHTKTKKEIADTKEYYQIMKKFRDTLVDMLEVSFNSLDKNIKGKINRKKAKPMLDAIIEKVINTDNEMDGIDKTKWTRSEFLAGVLCEGIAFGSTIFNDCLDD